MSFLAVLDTLMVEHGWTIEYVLSLPLRSIFALWHARTERYKAGIGFEVPRMLEAIFGGEDK